MIRRRLIVSLAALLGVVGVLLMPAATQAAPAPPAAALSVAGSSAPAPAQINLPPGLGFLGALLQNIFNSLTSAFPNLGAILGPIFTNIFNSLFGGCVGTFCTSP